MYTSQYAPQITGLEEVWDTYTGAGVKIAVIDSGITTIHEDFGGSDAFEVGYNYPENKEYATDDNKDFSGHGAHVAGIIEQEEIIRKE